MHSTLQKPLKKQSSSEKLHEMLNAKSSSRIGRLNKNQHAIAIQQLINEDSFTKDFLRKQAKHEGKALNTVVFKKDVKIDELLHSNQDRNVESISEIIKKMKQRNLRFQQFEKDQVLALHKVRDKSQESQEQPIEQKKVIEEHSSDDGDDMRDDVDREDALHAKTKDHFNAKDSDSDDGGGTKKKRKGSKKRRYYYQKFKNHERNLTLEFARETSHKYFSAFKTISRNQREYSENKMTYQIPGVGKYHPRFKVVEQLKPPITISKTELNRTRNVLIVNNSNSTDHYQSSRLNLAQSKVKHNYTTDLNDNYTEDSSKIRSLSQTLQKGTKTVRQPEINIIGTGESSVINHNSSIELTPYEDIRRKLNHSIHQTPSKMRDGWNNAHGMLDLNKQSQRKFVFENMIKVNDHRFNYMQLPQIYTKNKRVSGDVEFGKSSPRKELFKLKPYQPSYNPNYNQVMPKDPKYVNMNIKTMKDIYYNIE